MFTIDYPEYCFLVSAVPWKGGILLGDFCNNDFYYFDSLTGIIQYSPIPPITGGYYSTPTLLNADGDNLWAYGYPNELYYYFAANTTWSVAQLPSNAKIQLIAWDQQNNWLVLYFSSLGGPLPYEWAKITTNGNITNAPVPLNPGEVYGPGSINSIAQVLNEDGDYGTFNFLFLFYIHTKFPLIYFRVFLKIPMCVVVSKLLVMWL